ncbi:Hypothetical predicted protein [Paramuricea clavata]|uniref:Uncharacterized protein n=1 Tax=Paramuricea clavata TaxID=317549 RepID=A0A6S7J6P7_PARCT|nr:Hypothetical predicted protein [Paramuricea clavata]
MAAIHAPKFARIFTLYLVLYLILNFQNTGNPSANKARFLSIGSGSDIKIFPRRNEVLGRPTWILWTGSLVLLAGDICPQPGPGATNTISEKVGFDVKSRGLKIAHLNIRSLPSKLDELVVGMTNSKSFDILTLSETWLNPDISEDEINISGYL